MGSRVPRPSPRRPRQRRRPPPSPSKLRVHMDRAAIGRSAEDLAADFLVEQGLTVLLRNYRRRSGELDLVARDGNVLVIAEVRTRSSDGFGGAAASVDGWKQHKIIRATLQLLQQRKDLAQL